METGMIPICRPDISWREYWYVFKTLWQTQLSGETKIVWQFEEAFAQYIGTKYAVAVSSGWAALFLASWVLLRGKKVLLPDITMIAPANAALLAGAHVLCCDVDRDGLIDLKYADDLDRQYDAVIPVHLYGRPVSLSGGYKNKIIIEDCAEAHGAEINGRKIGSFGKVGCFSFYANKIITTGEGGMITTNDPALYEELIRLRSHYFGLYDKFVHSKMGFNFRMPALCAALGLAQLKRIDELIEKRSAAAEFYSQQLSGLVTMTRPVDSKSKQVYWMHSIHTPYRDDLQKWLEHCKIETRKWFGPLHQQLEFKDELYGYQNSLKLTQTGLLLPHTNETNLQYICDKIKEFFKNKALDN